MIQPLKSLVLGLAGEDSIVQDYNQGGVKGEYFDVWADGEIINTTDNEADAENSLREYRRKHPKR